MMKWFRWLAAFALTILSFLPIGLGGFVALSTDWVPTRGISSFELHRVKLATDFVERETKRYGRLPTYVEFQDWIKQSPPELRVDGQGFNYWPEHRQYSFSWWDGDASVTWRPESHLDDVFISPENVFFFGSKLGDLLTFFGSGAMLLALAYVLIRMDRRTRVHAS